MVSGNSIWSEPNIMLLMMAESNYFQKNCTVTNQLNRGARCIFPGFLEPGFLEEHVGSDHDVLAAARILGRGWVDGRRVE